MAFLQTICWDKRTRSLDRQTPGPVEQETLIAAINPVLPLIDSRFRDAPEVAGQLHMAAAAALDARTQYAASAKEFANASERYRQGEGPLSQNAMIAALRRDNAEMRTGIPATIAQAKVGIHVIENWTAPTNFFYFGKGGEMASSRADARLVYSRVSIIRV